MKTAITLVVLLICYVSCSPDFSQAIVQTLAGTGVQGTSADGIPANTAQLFYPAKCALNTNLNVMYCADYGQKKVRVIDLATKIISTIAGTGEAVSSGEDGSDALSAGLNGPHGVAYDASTNRLYFSEWEGHRVRYVTLSDGKIYHLMGSRTSTQGGFNVISGPADTFLVRYPAGIAIDSTRILVCDSANGKIRAIDKTTLEVTTIAGVANQYGFNGDGFQATSSFLTDTRDVKIVADKVYIADGSNNCVRVITSDGVLRSVAGVCGAAGFSGDNVVGGATVANLNFPCAIHHDSGSNTLFIADTNNRAVRMLDLSTNTIATIGGQGTAETEGALFSQTGNLEWLQGILYDPATEILYIVPQQAYKIRAVFRVPPTEPPTTTTTTAPPTTTIHPSCHLFDVSKYGAKKPDVIATAVDSTVTIAVTMYRQSLDNTDVPVFHNVDTKQAGSNVCRDASDNTVSSIGKSWAASSSACTTTYTLTQTLSDIVGGGENNNWDATLASDGRSITYSLRVFATYSVNRADSCYYAGFQTTVAFRTQLSVASSESTFITADKSAKFVFSGLRITPNNKFEIAGTIVPLVPDSTLENIALKQVSNNVAIPTATTSCAYSTGGCAQIYSVDVASLGSAGTDISGQYDTSMEVYEGGVSTRSVTISYNLLYTIPTDPTVVDSTTITTENKLYTDENYNVIRAYSYSSADNSLYIENSITAASPVIPAGYKLRMTEGYVCCVNYMGAISSGCKDQTAGIIEKASLGSETSHPVGVIFTPADVGSEKRYRLQVKLSQTYTAAIPHAAPMTCQVQLFSKLEAPAALRRIGAASNMDATFVSNIPFFVEAKQVVSGATIIGVSFVVTVAMVFINML